MKIRNLFKSINEVINDIFIRPIISVKENTEIEKYSINSSSYIDNKASIKLGKFTGFLLTLLSLLGISIFTDFFDKYGMIISIIVCSLSIIFMLTVFVIGLYRLQRYSIWHKKEFESIQKIINDINDKDKKRIISNLLEEGKTIDLIKVDRAIYNKILPPHLWNSFVVTENIVLFCLLLCIGMIFVLINSVI